MQRMSKQMLITMRIMVIISLLGFSQFESLCKIWSSKSFFHPESKDIFHFSQGKRKINESKKGMTYAIPFWFSQPTTVYTRDYAGF